MIWEIDYEWIIIRMRSVLFSQSFLLLLRNFILPFLSLFFLHFMLTFKLWKALIFLLSSNSLFFNLFSHFYFFLLISFSWLFLFDLFFLFRVTTRWAAIILIGFFFDVIVDSCDYLTIDGNGGFNKQFFLDLIHGDVS